MIYRSGSAFRQALETRLKARAQASSSDLWRLRKRVAADRLLASLATVAPGRWILKGGQALDLRLGDRARATRDVDIARQDDEAAAQADFRAVEARDGGDYFVFSITRTNRLDDADAGGAVRYHVRCLLAGTTFDELTVDVGFSTPLAAPPELIGGSDALSFAGIATIQVPVLPLGQHIAEKVHAYTRSYGALAQSSSRAKDLVDMVLLQANSKLEAGAIRQALNTVFEARATHPVPAALPRPPRDWRAAYRQMAASLAIPTDLDDGHQRAAALLDPILAGTAGDAAYWDHVEGHWIEE